MAKFSYYLLHLSAAIHVLTEVHEDNLAPTDILKGESVLTAF